MQKKKKRTWSTPVIVSQPVSLEVTMYLPADL